MSPTRIRRLLSFVACGGALASAALTAQPAHATPMGYLAALNAGGLSISDTVAAITAGYRICAELNTATGDVVVPRIYNTFSDVTSYDQATVMLIAAVENLCPEHDHRAVAA